LGCGHFAPLALHPQAGFLLAPSIDLSLFASVFAPFRG